MLVHNPKVATRRQVFALTGFLLISLSSLAPAVAQVRRNSRASVRIAVSSRPGNIVYLQLDLAKALHYFEDEGLDVQFKFYEGGPNTAKALEEGQVEFSGNSIDHAVYTRNAPRPLQMVAAFTDLPAVTLAVRRSLRAQIRSVGDLRGKRVGVAALNSGTHVILASIFKSANVPLSAVSVIPVGHTDQMIAAMKRGDIDAAVTTDPAAIRLLVGGDAALLLDLVTYDETQRVFTGSYAFTGLLTRSDVIAHRPAVVQAMVNAVIRANQFIATHSAADIADALPTSAKHDRYVFVKSIEHTRPSFSTDGIVTADGVANNIKSQKALGLVAPDKTLDPKDFFDMSFVMHTHHR